MLHERHIRLKNDGKNYHLYMGFVSQPWQAKDGGECTGAPRALWEPLEIHDTRLEYRY